ncbi:Protein phosphatase methylesterase 1 [Blyttiomyces sp. JEL0837]|nr:Protein phosphatase methylesterase 1 [Blyttiomyces sp. JEL0837]
MTDFMPPPPPPAVAPASTLTSTDAWKAYFETSTAITIPASVVEGTSNETDTTTIPTTDDIFTTYEIKSPQGPLFVFHHGAGHAALSWAVLAQQLKASMARQGGCSILCFDARGHGTTRTSDDAKLSLTQLSDDLLRVVAKMRRDDKQEIVLVGHSMGGAVAVEAANQGKIPNLVGVAVIDVVEGTAMDSLKYMESILSARPTSFRTLKEAVDWSLRTHAVGNRQSAEISIPAQLKLNNNRYEWITNLSASSVYWKDWFLDLSSKFLAVKAGRLLILAGTDRLDKALTIGQMQGKFQMTIFQETGHSVHEDAPEKLAATLSEFWQRNQRNVVIKRFPIPPKKT